MEDPAEMLSSAVRVLWKTMMALVSIASIEYSEIFVILQFPNSYQWLIIKTALMIVGFFLVVRVAWM